MTLEAPALVTISAAYGTGGSEIGPALARRLVVPFVDRAIPATVAQRLEVPVDEAVSYEEVPPSTFTRWMSHFAPAVQMFGGAAMLHRPPPADEDAFREATEHVLHEYARSGGVVLGRAGAVVLRDVPRALHVRLDGPREARRRQAMRLRGIDEAAAAEEMRVSDTARAAYVRRWYHVDAHDPTLYHLVIDATAIDIDACVELIVLALTARR